MELFRSLRGKKTKISKLVSNGRIATSSKNREFHAYRRSVNEMSNITRAGSTDLLLSARHAHTNSKSGITRSVETSTAVPPIDESYARIDPL